MEDIIVAKMANGPSGLSEETLNIKVRFGELFREDENEKYEGCKMLAFGTADQTKQLIRRARPQNEDIWD